MRRRTHSALTRFTALALGALATAILAASVGAERAQAEGRCDEVGQAPAESSIHYLRSSILCLVPTALEGGIAPLRAFSLTAVGAETLAVRARGAEVRTLVPDAASAAVMGANLMDPRRSEAVLDAAFAQGRALAA